MNKNHVYMFFTNDPCDLDLYPSKSKIKQSRGLTKTNQHVEY